MGKMNDLSAELSKVEDLRAPNSKTIGMMNIKSALDWSIDAKNRPDPNPLWKSLWYEGEAGVLFADTNLGKSILSVQIAEHIARDLNQKVLYFDFELADKQFQLRYTDEGGHLYQFSPNFYRAEIDSSAMIGENFEDAVVNNIEDAAKGIGAKIIIIDNLTFLCTQAEKGDIAGALMLRLIQMKKSQGFSMLLISHTPKRDLGRPITQNDLAGSKKFINLFDSAFAIGKSAKDSNLRYIKQIKCRNGAFTYNEENVIVCDVKKTNAFLSFEIIGYSSEAEHLRQQSPEMVKKRNDEVLAQAKEGKSIRMIAEGLGMSNSSVYRIIKKAKEDVS